MTYEDAVKSGMDGIDIFMGLCSGEIEEDKKEYVHQIWVLLSGSWPDSRNQI